MIPFLGTGADQLADRFVEEPSTGARAKFEGDDGTRIRTCINYRPSSYTG